MGRRAGLPVAISPLPTASAVLQAVRRGAADIGFVAPNPERTGVVLYSQTYMLVQQSALVRADSPLRSVGELDRPGQVLGVTPMTAWGVWLQERLTAARVRRDARLYASRRCPMVAGRRGGGIRWRPTAYRRRYQQRFLACGFWTTTSMRAAGNRRADDRENRLALVNAALDEFRAALLADAVARSGIDGLAVARRGDFVRSGGRLRSAATLCRLNIFADRLPSPDPLTPVMKRSNSAA